MKSYEIRYYFNHCYISLMIIIMIRNKGNLIVEGCQTQCIEKRLSKSEYVYIGIFSMEVKLSY